LTKFKLANQTILYFTELQIELERKSGLDEPFTSGSIVRSNSDDFMCLYIFSQRPAEAGTEAVGSITINVIIF
jgi:hypothetical protein